MAILHRVRAFAKRHELWGPDTRVIAAVSGGADSTALFLLLHELATQGELMLDAIAHLHHGIRGAAADDDETLCRALAAEHGVPYVSARADVPALAHRDRVSIEVAGRRARYTFFEDVRRTRGADRIATAHTRDDQAETVILRLVRGVELAAGEIASHFDVTRPAISQHLAILKDAGLLSERREGTKRIYRLRPEGLHELRDFIDAMWSDRLRALKSAAEADERRGRGAGGPNRRQ